MKGIELTPVEDLVAGSLDVGSVTQDWSEGFGDEWEFFEVPTCGACGTDERVKYVDGEWRCYGKDAPYGGHEWGAEVDEQGDGPMMNYYYPVDDVVIERHGDDAEAAMKLKGLPLCIVHFLDRGIHGQYALALTGGGMDLSWEICEAFMRLGELPPTKFADLPGMAGRPSDDTDRWVVAGCIRALEVAAERAEWNAARGVERMSGWLASEVPV